MFPMWSFTSFTFHIFPRCVCILLNRKSILKFYLCNIHLTTQKINTKLNDVQVCKNSSSTVVDKFAFGNLQTMQIIPPPPARCHLDKAQLSWITTPGCHPCCMLCFSFHSYVILSIYFLRQNPHQFAIYSC